ATSRRAAAEITGTVALSSFTTRSAACSPGCSTPTPGTASTSPHGSSSAPAWRATASPLRPRRARSPDDGERERSLAGRSPSTDTFPAWKRRKRSFEDDLENLALSPIPHVSMSTHLLAVPVGRGGPGVGALLDCRPDVVIRPVQVDPHRDRHLG